MKEGIKSIRKQGYNGSLVILATYDVQTEYEMSVSGKITANTFSSGGFNTQCPSIDGVPIITVPDNRMYTSITLYDGRTSGQTAGGYVKGSTAKDINFIIVPQFVPIAVTKQDKMKIFSPDVNQQSDDWLMNYRRYHDLWVLDNKKSSIYLCTK